MKTKHLFFAAALPIAFAACTNDDFTQNAGTIGQDDLGKLIEAPMLGVGMSNSAGTKAYVEVTEGGVIKKAWQWFPSLGGEDGDNITGVDRIGLCWTGVNNNPNGYEGPRATTGDMVYGNVEFDHVGWLYEGEKVPSIVCDELKNGEFHVGVNSENKTLTPQAAFDNGTWSAEASGEKLDFGTGMFKSGNGTIYEGEYIVYFPYNNAFWNAPITAQQDRILNLKVDGTNQTVVDPYQLMTEQAFNVGYKEQINGGDDACEFATDIVTTGIKFNMSGESNVEIKEIVLWSKGEKAFKTSQALSAAKIKEAWTGGKLDKNVNVFMEDANNAASSTLVVRMVNESNKTENLKIASKEQNFYVPFLPTKIANLHVMIVKKDGTVADLAFWGTGLDFTQYNAPKTLTLKVEDDGKLAYYKSDKKEGEVEFTAKNYAYDETSFQEAFEKARTNAKNEAREPRTVTLLDNIALTDMKDVYNNGGTYSVIVESDPNLPEGEKSLLTLGHTKEVGGNAVQYAFQSTYFDVNVETSLKGCCNINSNSLTLIKSTTAAGTNLTMNGGKLTLRDGVEFFGNVYSKVEKNVGQADIFPEIVLDSYDSNAEGTVIANAEFLNEGEMTVKKKFDFYLAGAAELTNKGQIKVEGDENDRAYIAIGRECTVTNNGQITNMGEIYNDKGTFDNDGESATFTDYVGSSLSGSRLVNKNGANFICEVNSKQRYADAIDLDGIRPTTIVRFVYGEDVNLTEDGATFTTEYTLKANDTRNGVSGIYVPYSENNALIKFESCIDNNTNNKVNTLKLSNETPEEDEEVAPVTIGGLTVKSGRITLEHQNLTIDGNYEADGALNTNLMVGIKKVTGDFKLTYVAINNDGGTGNVVLQENKTLDVDGDIIVGKVQGKVSFKESTKVYAQNMTVASGATVDFARLNRTYLGQENKDGVLTNNGTVDIYQAVSGSSTSAEVWCYDTKGNGEYPNNRVQYYND